MPESGNSAGGGQSKAMLRLARLPRLYRLFRISKILKLIKTNSSSAIIIKLQDLFSLKQSAIRLVGVFIAVIAIAHIIGCLWFFSAKIEGLDPDTWVSRSGYLDEDEGFLYLTSLYWTYTTISTVGYGDISPKTGTEKVMAIILMLFGVCFFSFVIGTLSSILSRMDTKETMMLNKMAIIDEFSRDANLSSDLKSKLRFAL